MPFSSNGGFKIYYETEGPDKGFPIILHTGGAGDMNMWRHAGYVAGLKSDFKLILVDHRGRGKSDKPATLEAHKIEAYVSDIIALMNNLEIEQSAFWGYSAGATVGFTLASRHQDRIRSLIVSGDFGEWLSYEDTASIISTLRKSGTEALIQEFERDEGTKTPEPLRLNLISTPDSETFALNLEAWLELCNYDLVSFSFNTPTLIINGEKEDPERKGEELAKRIPNSRALTLKGLGHLGAYARSDLVLPTAREFLKKLQTV